MTVYGQDFGDGTNLRTLISALNEAVPKGTWLRLLYLHPNRVDEALIDFLMTQDKVLHYLDIPIQHSDPKILSLMNRPCPEGHMRRIFTYIRELEEIFASYGLKIYDKTPMLKGRPRDKEIERFLYFHRINDYIVIDGDQDEYENAGSHVYFIDPETGFTKKDAHNARKMLKKMEK